MEFRVPGGCCAVARKGLPARKSLPARLRGRDREGLLDECFDIVYLYITIAGINAASREVLSICVRLVFVI